MPPESSQKKPLLAGESLASRGEESSTLRLAGSTPLNASPLALGAPPIAGTPNLYSPAGAAKPGKTLNGTAKADTLVGGSGNQTLRGKGSNDTLWGDKTDGSQGGSDTFVFEKSLASNGLDTIKDYQWSADNSDGLGQDVLDLTAALKSFKAALKTDPNASINDYVRLEEVTGVGMKLMVDTDGTGAGSSAQWAFLEGLTASDPVRVRAFTASASGSGSGPNLGDGYYTIPDKPALPDYITVGRDGMWFDTNEDGLLNGDETLLGTNGPDTDGFYTINDPQFNSFGDLNYTVRFVDAKTPYPLDLTGFGAGDKLIIDGQTNFGDWYGLEDDYRDMLGKTANHAFTQATVSGSDFGIYPASRGANNYIYGSISPSAFAYAYMVLPSSNNTIFKSPSAQSKLFGRASFYALPSTPFRNHFLAKGLPVVPSPGTGFEFLLDVIKPTGEIVSYP